VTSIKKQIMVETSQQRAFRTFTDGIDRWWPRDHHIGQSPLERMIVEPRTGGRWYSICKDGAEIDVGKVVAWEPPHRLVLTWQITAQWQYDPAFSTEVEVGFFAEGLDVTRPAVSQHLKVLLRAGLVVQRREGNRSIYQVDPRGVAAMRDYLDRFWDRALAAFKLAAEQEDT